MPKNVVAIIQARMGSTRLPGKVLKDIQGKPMLWYVVERTKKAHAVNQVVVATTTDIGDDAITSFCQALGYLYYRGSIQDVLDRFYQAAKTYKADIVVRITSDCPLIDPELIDLTVNALLLHDVDFATNRLPPPFTRTYPIGLDVEVCTFAALERAWHEASSQHEREHVMPYFYEKEGRFKIFQVNNSVDYGRLRWTVDTQADLEVIRKIFTHFSGRIDFNWLEVLELNEKSPEMFKTNKGVVQKTLYDH
jgi:spore coat polysaccharide biosynthesis protein SpsF